MSDMIDMYRSMDDLRRIKRDRMGLKCPVCVQKLPRAQPKVLLHGQVCRAHKPHYRDPRPEPTADEFNAIMAGTGWTQKGIIA